MNELKVRKSQDEVLYQYRELIMRNKGFLDDDYL
jgi:hypothetical protein